MRTIATRVYTQEEITLNNEERDITVMLRPLPVARLREFMVQWDAMKELDAENATEDEIFEIYIKCCGVALRKQLAVEVNEKVFDDKREFTKEYIDLLEDFLDLPSIVKILDICGGVKLESPKAMEALETLLAEAEDGTN